MALYTVNGKRIARINFPTLGMHVCTCISDKEGYTDDKTSG